THQMFETVDHQHLDSLVYKHTDELPESALCLIECADGKFFVEVDFGNEFDSIDGISRPEVKPYQNPYMFSDEKRARAFAIECIKSVHEELAKVDFKSFIEIGE
ncbi:hypothetical protein A3715_37725, partial [Oleiphilus sp. HI0009]